MQTPTSDELNESISTRRELLDAGYTDPQIRARVRSGELHRVRHGSYVDRAFWESLSVTDQYRVLIRAVLKRAHPTAVVSHISAAVERGAPVWCISLDEVHLTRTDGKTGRREAGVVHHRGHMPEDHVEHVNGLPLSAPARCAIEVTTMTTVEPALVTVNGMLHAGMLSSGQLAAMAQSLKHWPDSLNTALVIRLCDARIESVGETRFDFLCWSQHLSRPTPQVKVRDEFGQVVARVDFAWPDLGVFVEFDGKEKYRRFRRENESLEEFLMREKKREERICQVTGWVCIRIGWADLEQPQRTARRLRRVLASRRPFGA
jgi:very-short-patch-repair endonuclease